MTTEDDLCSLPPPQFAARANFIGCIGCVGTVSYMAATLGAATFSSMPYAGFNLASPLLVVAIAYANIRMPRAAALADRHH